MEDAARRDDRILPATRWTFLVFALILVSAVIILWGTPGRTAERWAWTIEPEMTPIFMGSVYVAGAFVFFRLFFAKEWHPYSAVLIGAVVLTSLLLITTLVHFDRFNHGDGPLPADIAFYGWVGIYALAPFWIAALYARNRHHDPGLTGAEPLVSGSVRRAAAVGGGVGLLVAALFLLWPDGIIDVWPWTLTPLTARVLGSYVATIGTLGLVLSRDPRWSSWKLIAETLLVFGAFLFVGALRAFDDFDTGNVLTWLFLALPLLAGAALLWFRRSMEVQARVEAQAPA